MREKKINAGSDSESISISFQDNSLLPMLFGNNDENLTRLEKQFNVKTVTRGNMLAVSGSGNDVEAFRAVLESLHSDLKKGIDIGSQEVDAAIRMVENGNYNHDDEDSLPEIRIKTLRKSVRPYSPAQTGYMKSLAKNDVVFVTGPAGTGKTYIAVAQAVAMFADKKVEKIILSRPAVEAGEKLGFLPGDLKEKIDPYLRPLYDALHDMIPIEKLTRYMETGEIEVAPLAFMRGRTLSNAFVILDEAQNTTPTQMKMFLTRLGENSRMVITGDLTQTDLPKDIKSGLADVIRKVEKIDGIGCVRFTDRDVVRHPLAAKIIKAYDDWEKNKKKS
ncbi:MAG: PhoH family protein [Rickettsiales bacterium]